MPWRLWRCWAAAWCCLRCIFGGRGDAKLLAAAAVILGAKGLPLLIFATAMAGGALALLWLILRRLRRRRASPFDGVPYGVAIACGAVVAFRRHPTPRAIFLRRGIFFRPKVSFRTVTVMRPLIVVLVLLAFGVAT